MCGYVELRRRGTITDLAFIDSQLDSYPYTELLPTVLADFEDHCKELRLRPVTEFFDLPGEEACPRRDAEGPWFTPEDGLATFSALVSYYALRVDEYDSETWLGRWLMAARSVEQILRYAKDTKDEFRMTW